MADVKTSAEDQVSGLSGDELVRIVQDGASVRTTAQAIADLSDNADAYNDAAAFDAFGDSITLGTGASDAAHRYANLISTRRGWTLTNHGVSGDMVADQAAPVFAKVVAIGSQSTLMLGTNDQRTYQASLPKQDAFKLGHLALAAWLALADSKKVYGQAGALTGTWTNSVVYAAGLMKQSIVPASTATYTVYGTTVYIGSVLQNSIVATFSVAIDGVAKGTFSCAPVGVTITSVNALTYMPQLLRFPGLSEGAHSVVITVVTASGSNPVYVAFVAGNGGARTKTGPNLWVGNVPRFTAAGYSASGGSDAVVASFNRMIRDNVRLLAGDGLNVALADSCANLNTAADIGGDGVHPDDSGHDVIAEAFLEAINQIQKPSTVERPSQPPQIVETETGTTYTFLPSDHGKLKILSNGSSIAATLPQAGSNFPNGWRVDVQAGGAGTVTITPTTSTIAGASTQVLSTGQSGRVTSDGTNYKVTALAGSTVATGAGTVTNTGGNLTANALVLGAGTADAKVVAGIISDGTSKITLGVAGSSVGSVDFKNATSGTITVSPVAGALGSVTLSLPAATDTLVGKATTDTLTNKTLTNAVVGTQSALDNSTKAASTAYADAAASAAKVTECIMVAMSDETTALTTGTKVTMRMPYAFTLTSVRASVTTAATGATLLGIDIKETGTTIFSTKPTLDASEKTTTTAATASVLSDTSLADDAEMTFIIDAVGNTIAGAGLKAYLIGHRT